MPTDQTTIMLGPKFEQALLLANQVHARQQRKESGAPYLAHVLGVAALVLEDGGSETEAIAALLHDTAEDGGGEAILDQIGAQFGPEVAEIVRQCSDTLETPKPPWQGRKEAHLVEMQTARPETLRVVLADKVHNARTLLRSLKESGERVWSSFKGGREGTLWYFHQMHALLDERCPGYLVDELARVVAQIEVIGRARMAVEVVNFADKMALFADLWSPKIIAQMNDYHFKLVRIEGEFVWHSHPKTDEVFIVVNGQFEMQLRDGSLTLKSGEMCVVPRGVEHRPVAAKECAILLIEPAGTINTGDTGGERTAAPDIWI